MKLFLDTNIIMDYMESREPFVVYALDLLQKRTKCKDGYPLKSQRF